MENNKQFCCWNFQIKKIYLISVKNPYKNTLVEFKNSDIKTTLNWEKTYLTIKNHRILSFLK